LENFGNLEDRHYRLTDTALFIVTQSLPQQVPVMQRNPSYKLNSSHTKTENLNIIFGTRLLMHYLCLRRKRTVPDCNIGYGTSGSGFRNFSSQLQNPLQGGHFQQDN